MAAPLTAAKLPQPGTIFKTRRVNGETLPDIPEPALSLVDAILVLGGGVPSSFKDPPVYVKTRCDMAAHVFHALRGVALTKAPAILTLSAGTAHMAQLLSQDGLPIWEATASAAYLMEKHGIPERNIFAETTSYDTISNAYFARTSFADVIGWRRLLIVTNEFHMARSKAIFEWIFGAENSFASQDMEHYELYYLSCDNVGLSEDAILARKAHEARSAKNVQTKLSKEYDTLQGIFSFLTRNHDFYNARKLVNRASRKGQSSLFDPRSTALRLSYGGDSSLGVSFSHIFGFLTVLTILLVAFTMKYRKLLSRKKRHDHEV